MSEAMPLASQEVRWFLEGNIDRHQSLKHWFEREVAAPRRDGGSLRWWQQRVDVYLMLTGSADMGIKWREGKLQIKGRVSACGTEVFGGRHQGAVERWMKWSYDRVPAAYRALFTVAEAGGLMKATVRKTRALRKMRLDTFTGKAEEVPLGAAVDRGLEVELVDLEVAGNAYCSLAFGERYLIVPSLRADPPH